MKSKWKLQSNEKGLFILTLDGPEGQDKLWLDANELGELRMFLNTLEIPQPENELPL